jgi:hypothetical protein
MDKGLAQAMSINKVLFVCGAFTKQPPAMSLMEAGSQKGTYVIDATLAKGGPLLKLSLPSNATEEGRFKLGPGSLFHPREYWDDATGTPMPPSDELTDAFRRLRKVIKDNTVLRRVPGKIWIGRDADRLFKDGVADVLIDGRWIPLKTLKQM